MKPRVLVCSSIQTVAGETIFQEIMAGDAMHRLTSCRPFKDRTVRNATTTIMPTIVIAGLGSR
jgi:hypothetical protein